MSQTNKRAEGPVQALGRRRLLQFCGTLPMVSMLGACGNLLPGQGPPPSLFRLTPKSTFRSDLPDANWQLVLETPVSDASFNTTRIVLQESPTQIDYYANAGWADRAPVMVQTLMVESFENSGRIVAVGREAISLRSDFILKSELREFQAIFFEGFPPLAAVNLNLKLVQMPRRAIVGSTSFAHKERARSDSLDDIVDAFDKALGKVLKGVVEWTLLTGQEALQNS
ncbi:MAG: ABC-type transport auxiliary lipoprotein family protein [Pseudomonadota bacterium]